METSLQVIAEAEANYASYKSLVRLQREALVTNRLRSLLADIISIPHLPSSRRNALQMRYGIDNILNYAEIDVQIRDITQLAAAHKDEHLDIYIEEAEKEMSEHFEAQALLNMPEKGQLELPFRV